ncbi:hypothetical protein I5M27_06795 [Adhaeribacter sp. BT258]|uniref:SpoIIAA-like n=1 Tax=Adhaeribacter terrigena TaxID=2793070 RepID=A0ABS1BZW1_9BACT|nr:hypothetical protein [Adhaeribacter terrigena]MBK0402686.1 hypothetical protein [Adhaeribacter terrigena]
MILEEDSLMHFRYDTITHILSTTWPDLTHTPMPEIEDTLEKLASNIQYYDVRYMLADHRTGYAILGEDKYKKLIENYHRRLAETNLEKVARILPEEPAWEYLIANNTKKLQKKLRLKFKIRFFNHKTDAMAWLQEAK